jgi:hypothetical protein
VIFYYLWKLGFFARADGEKLRYFLGLSPDPLLLSRRRPLVSAINWVRAVFSTRYAPSDDTWLEYRVELYDGLQG